MVYKYKILFIFYFFFSITIKANTDCDSYNKGIELLNYSMNLLHYGEKYSLDPDFNKQIFEDYRILVKNYASRFQTGTMADLAIGLGRFAYRWGSNKVKQSIECGCGSKLELKKCCGYDLW